MIEQRKTALIIGSSGEIGAEIVRTLRHEPYQFILHYNENETVVKQIINELDEDQLLAMIKADLSTEKGVHQLIQLTAFHVDLIIFAQGRAHYGLFTGVSESTIDELYHIHVKAPLLISKAFLPSMIKNQSGKIIIITSIWGEIGASNEVVYSTMKGAQIAFAKSLAKEVGTSNINVNAISPGLIQTKMNDVLDENDLLSWQNDVPLKRLGTVHDVAKTTKFLASSDANYIHGQIIRVNGGRL
ncbi:elongation factor P 5-aminopentanone reductase [Bacillaceae bacterium W0354]